MDLLERVAATGLLEAGRPVVVLLSGGRDSVCLLDVAVALAGAARCARCTSTTGCAREADADEAHCRALCARARRRARGPPRRRPDDAPGNLQAWARDVRYAAAARLARRARRAARRRPHRDRPGRDDPLPARRVARPPRAARHGAARRAARAPAARRHARGDRGVVPRARAAHGARTPTQRRPTVTRARACAAALVPALRAVHPRGRAQRRCAPPSCCATRPRCSTRSSTRRSPGATAIARRRTSRRCRRALARLVVRRLAEARDGRAVRPRRRPRSTTSSRSRRRARSTSATARAPSSRDGVLRFERTPPPAPPGAAT